MAYKFSAIAGLWGRLHQQGHVSLMSFPSCVTLHVLCLELREKASGSNLLVSCIVIPLPKAGFNLPYQDKMLSRHILHALYCHFMTKCLLALQKQDQTCDIDSF